MLVLSGLQELTVFPCIVSLELQGSWPYSKVKMRPGLMSVERIRIMSLCNAQYY